MNVTELYKAPWRTKERAIMTHTDSEETAWLEVFEGAGHVKGEVIADGLHYGYQCSKCKKLFCMYCIEAEDIKYHLCEGSNNQPVTHTV